MQAYIWALVCTKNMTGIAKIVSEKTGKDITPLELDKDKFVEISNTPDTYVLGRAYGDHLMVGLGVDYQISVEKR